MQRMRSLLHRRVRVARRTPPLKIFQELSPCWISELVTAVRCITRTNLNLTSTGMIATQAGVSHARVIRAIEKLRVEPGVVLNGVRYFDVEAVEQIQEHVARSRACQQTAVATAAS
jgi:hypothetical protein